MSSSSFFPRRPRPARLVVSIITPARDHLIGGAEGRDVHAPSGAERARRQISPDPQNQLRAAGHATDSSAKTLFPGLAGSRVEAALQASF